jgi:adenylate cyclase class IV
MNEIEKRIGLQLEDAQRLKSELDERYARKSVANRTVIVKVDNNDFSPNPDALVDIKTKLIGDQTLLSAKLGSWHGDSRRREYEVHFRREDLPNMLAVLGLLGYTKFIVLAAIRTTWAGAGVNITLDEYPKLAKALFEVELENPEAAESLIDDVFSSLGLAPMDSQQTISFIASLNNSREIQVDLETTEPYDIAHEILTGH